MKQHTSKILKLLAALHLAAPLLYIFLAAVLFDIPLSRCVGILLSPLYYLTTICAAIAGYGLLEMRRWSWYLFFVSQILFTYENANIVIEFSSSYHKIFAFLLTLFFQLLVIYRVSKEIRVPYFFPNIRWWESNPKFRFSLPVSLTIDSQEELGGQAIHGEILDLSLLGCFIKSRQDVTLEERVSLRFHVFGNEFLCEGQVVWLAQSTVTFPKGLGIKFSFLSKGQRKLLKNVQRKMKKLARLYRTSRYWLTADEFEKQWDEIVSSLKEERLATKKEA